MTNSQKLFAFTWWAGANLVTLPALADPVILQTAQKPKGAAALVAVNASYQAVFGLAGLWLVLGANALHAVRNAPPREDWR